MRHGQPGAGDPPPPVSASVAEGPSVDKSGSHAKEEEELEQLQDPAHHEGMSGDVKMHVDVRLMTYVLSGSDNNGSTCGLRVRAC